MSDNLNKSGRNCEEIRKTGQSVYTMRLRCTVYFEIMFTSACIHIIILGLPKCLFNYCYSYKRMLSPPKNAAKKIRRESEESEKTAVRKTVDTKQMEIPKISTDKSSKIDTKRRSTSNSPIKTSNKFTQNTSPESSKAVDEYNSKRTKQNLTSKTKEKSVSKKKVAKNANKMKFTALKIKLKSPKESRMPGRSAKKHVRDVPREKSDTLLKQRKTNETVTSKQKLKVKCT